MKRNTFHGFIVISLFWYPIPRATATETTAEPAAAGHILRLGTRLDGIVGADAKLEKLADGYAWLEGPVWLRREGALLFSDVPNNVIHRYHPESGVTVFMQPSGYTGTAPFTGSAPGSNGLAVDPMSGRLVICQHGDRRVVRIEADGSKTILAERYEGKRLNSPNDAVFRANGDLYFTDPPYGLPQGFKDPGKELPISGVYRLPPGGELMVMVQDLTAPNGLAFSPDGKALYLSDSDPDRPAWYYYDVREDDGVLENRRLFADALPFTTGRKGAPDGIKVDREGNVFAAGPGGVYIFAPDGEHLGTIETGVPTANLAFGNDGSMLYITAETTLYRISLLAVGDGF
ncbi:MAG: SMP-30/gluconolactonase/LRE family protein [Gammaproteobacteria bacterium]|nr:SMP-30/gluconolactonase/LRE family protein [Gammaproteobacteria bacterium]